ncbi:MAG TPA: sulfate ABC transporter permease subunit CysW [Chthoniobacterales bacterium]
MAGAVSHLSAKNHGSNSLDHETTREPWFIKWLLIVTAVVFLAFFLLLPLAAVFTEALRKGWGAYFSALSDSDTYAAIRLTLLTAAVAVPLNLVFGIAAAWAISKFDFPGRAVLITLIDLPFAVSPVISGLIYVLLFGAQGWLPPDTLQAWLAPVASTLQWGAGWPILGGFVDWLNNPRIVFAVPGIILATVFVTFPFVARELIPLMQSQGTEEEQAAVSLGASGLQTFFRVTLPNIKWGLLYGVILCNARAMGEFGAVSVVSGHIRGLTNTIPLQVEILYNEYNYVGAFATASILTLLAFLTLILKTAVEARAAHSAAAHEQISEPAPPGGVPTPSRA